MNLLHPTPLDDARRVVVGYVTGRRLLSSVPPPREVVAVGAYFLVVNPAKRQYLDPARFGEAAKFSGLLRGDYCLQALKLLISDCFQRDAAAFRGAWARRSGSSRLRRRRPAECRPVGHRNGS